MVNAVRDLWLHRSFIAGNVKREFQSRYLNSLLGAAWTVIHPLSLILIYTLIFSQIMQAKLPGVDDRFGYSIYLCSGILTWGLFSEITGGAHSLFLENGNLLKKMNFPWLCLPVTQALNACLNFAIIFGLFVSFLLLSGNFPGWVMLALIPMLALQLLFATSLGVVLGVLNVFFRDVGHFYAVVLQFWFWLTPIVYPLSILPEKLQSLIRLNPMTGLMEGYHTVLVHNELPAIQGLMPVAGLTIVFMALGTRLFRNHSNEIVDEL
ncbi:ABC transporter permease [Halomonadaceae bacterium KBTZ08]